jgi:hypothetical protein
VVKIESVVLCALGEECPTNDLSSSFLEQTFHYAMSFRAEKEGLVLRFRDQFKGNDDKV